VYKRQVFRNSFAAETERVIISPVATLAKLALALVIVLFVFWLFAKVMQQVQGFKTGSQQDLSVICALPVGQRERVVIVQAGDQQLVLGVTSSQINKLHVLERPLSTRDQSLDPKDFKNKLSAAMKRQVSRE